MDLYSILLATSSLTLGAGMIATLVHLLPGWLWGASGGRSPRGHLRTWPWCQMARWAAFSTLFLVALATGLHLIAGHRPGTEGALGPVGFLTAHRALVVLPALAVVILWLVRGEATGDDARLAHR